MSILRFRVIFDDYDDIHRDIDLQADHTFADLFLQIMSSIGFDNKHKGVFYMADHNLRKGELIGEITGEDLTPLNKVDLVDRIDDPHQKFLFSYDENNPWNFNIELIKIMPDAEYKTVYPKVAAVVGAPPVQYKETLIIPNRERTEPDGRGRKPKIAAADDDLQMFAAMASDDEDPELGEIAETEENDDLVLGLPEELDLETDSEIAKLAEEFNNTTETSGAGAAEEDEEYGFGDDEDDEFGEKDEDEFGGGYGGGGGSDYDE